MISQLGTKATLSLQELPQSLLVIQRSGPESDTPTMSLQLPLGSVCKSVVEYDIPQQQHD